MGFIGSFSHKPNILALEFLFEAVLPELAKYIPNLRVLIAGKNPPKNLMALAPDCVDFAGFIPSVNDFYKQIGIVVAPLVTGGGVKIKVIEGLLSGLPVVTTSIGAEGIGLTDGVNAFIADNPDDFVAAVVKLSQSSQFRSELGIAGQQHAMMIGSADLHSSLVDSVFASICS